KIGRVVDLAEQGRANLSRESLDLSGFDSPFGRERNRFGSSHEIVEPVNERHKLRRFLLTGPKSGLENLFAKLRIHASVIRELLREWHEPGLQFVDSLHEAFPLDPNRRNAEGCRP